MQGWMGKLLRVDLTTGRLSVEMVDPEVARDFIGGRGWAIRYLYDEVDPGVDPLSEGNKVIFATGPLTATLTPSGARYMVVTKSPLTGAITCANAGGEFPTEMKRTGFDMFIFEGRSPRPIYLWVNDDQAELRPADHLWGMDVHTTVALIRKETDPKVRVACIGPAGEKLVKIAAIMNDAHRAAGRAGVGAVLGYKNLKAVAVRGHNKVSLADPEKLMDISKEVRKEVEQIAKAGKLVLRDYGTAYVATVTNSFGIIPTRNFQSGVFAGAEVISGEILNKKYLIRPKPCHGCPIACGRVTRVEHPLYGGEGEGPEYETLAAFGSSCGIDNLEAIIKANYLCNELGLDTISTGMTISCAMELYEKGYLPQADVGRPLEFGDAGAIVDLTRKTALREGFGDLLAEGSFRLASRYGHPEVSISSKKLEFPGYDPRGVKGMGILYATSNIGASHMRGDTIYVELGYVSVDVDPLTHKHKAHYCKHLQDIFAVIDSVGLCVFVAMRHFVQHNESLSMTRLADLMNSATGVGYDPKNLLLAGERIYNLERLFLLKAGFTKDDDTLPPRMLKEPMPEGPAQGQVVELDVMLPEYYQLRGWSSEGIPTEEKLKELGLD
ncbi:MAG: aldehyde ferredoxin oxidoreductase family protein [Deltaproteobacteria bacterium]|nr:aldehyde ferredoxin oxidoreductase family protein [Deltaproteobacteria bacterium]MBW2026761.1 aldehyde ferredoxin oxidoreductase family protein [Deltaproteobacteria bacterium]MBW2127266.1 aldehyde ferredoxin oxidoreductase family protein [Deltaproteobacteria bacterium]